MKKIITTLAMILIVSVSQAQDVIVKKSGDKVLCKVAEIGSTEIKYHKWENLEGPVYSIKTMEVTKITFENGTEEVFKANEFSVIPTEGRNYKRAVTTHPMSILAGHLNFGYQQAISRNTSFVGELGIIGPRLGDGFSNRDSKGGYLKAGYRLKRTPEVVSADMEWGHNMGGMYVQPTLALAVYKETMTKYNYDYYTGQSTTTTSKDKVVSGALLINLGRQMIVGDIMTFDISAGLGFGVANQSESYGRRSFNYSHGVASPSIPLAYDFSFSMGFLIK